MDTGPILETAEDPARHRPSASFSPVRPDKFVLLSLLTFGAYEVVWLYRNWREVRESEGSNIWPWARALFGPIWYYPLLGRLEVRGRLGLAVAFWLCLGLSRLPDPYWLLSSLSIVPLLPAVAAVNGLNRGVARSAVPSYAWRKRSVAVLVIGVLVVPLMSAGAFGPPTAVVSGPRMRAVDARYLSGVGLLEEGEEILYFYSPGYLSARGEGTFASNLGVTSYWTDPVSEDLSFAFLRYEEIVDIEVNYSTSFLDDTVVRITGPDEVWFVFFLSAEGGGDRLFLEEVERRRRGGPPDRVSA